MSTTFSFIKGVGFTLAMFTSFLVGFAGGRDSVKKEMNEDDEKDSVQDAEFEEI